MTGRAGTARVQLVLAELAESGLELDNLRANPGKLRLSLDLAGLIAASPGLRLLDVGCAGPTPLNLWEPFGPLFGRFELVGVDIDGTDRAEDRARQLDIPITIYRTSALALTVEFGHEGFDVVVSTQVLEHVRDWRGAIAEMRDVIRPGGTMLLTCDSRHVRRTVGTRLRLQGKRGYAVARDRAAIVRRLGDRLVSGEWKKARRLASCATLRLSSASRSSS